MVQYYLCIKNENSFIYTSPIINGIDEAKNELNIFITKVIKNNNSYLILENNFGEIVYIHTNIIKLSQICIIDKITYDTIPPNIGISTIIIDGLTIIGNGTEESPYKVNNELFELKENKAVPDGYASLDSSGKVPNNQLPNIKIDGGFAACEYLPEQLFDGGGA